MTPLISRAMYARCMQYDGTNAQEIIAAFSNALPADIELVVNVSGKFIISRERATQGQRDVRRSAFDIVESGSWVVVDIHGVVAISQEQFSLFSR